MIDRLTWLFIFIHGLYGFVNFYYFTFYLTYCFWRFSTAASADSYSPCIPVKPFQMTVEKGGIFWGYFLSGDRQEVPLYCFCKVCNSQLWELLVWLLSPLWIQIRRTVVLWKQFVVLRWHNKCYHHSQRVTEQFLSVILLGLTEMEDEVYYLTAVDDLLCPPVWSQRCSNTLVYLAADVLEAKQILVSPLGWLPVG